MKVLKVSITVLILLCSLQFSFSQERSRVLFQVQSSDTLVYKSVVSQIMNLKKEMPEVEVEVLCHGPGIDFLRAERAHYASKLMALQKGDIRLVACEFTMSQRKLKRSDIVSFANTVPYGIVEVVQKQQEGWIYLKAGF